MTLLSHRLFYHFGVKYEQICKQDNLAHTSLLEPARSVPVVNNNHMNIGGNPFSAFAVPSDFSNAATSSSSLDTSTALTVDDCSQYTINDAFNGSCDEWESGMSVCEPFDF